MEDALFFSKIEDDLNLFLKEKQSPKNDATKHNGVTAPGNLFSTFVSKQYSLVFLYIFALPITPPQ
jgi:hypothetical protein